MNQKFAIILAGGSGTRLWPLSRQFQPKQLLKLTGEKTLLQETALRLLLSYEPQNICVITQNDYVSEVKDQLAEIHPTLTEHVFIEPLGRNTLPAISWAVQLLSKQHSNPSIGVFPADHVISDNKAFCRTLEIAQIAANDGRIGLFGVSPTFPTIDYGYIQTGKTLKSLEMGKIQEVLRFVEKPDLETAEAYLKQGGFYWNGGIFTFTADSFLELLKEHQPQISLAAQKLAEQGGFVADIEIYKTMPSLSIDRGLVEKISSRVAVVPAEMGWGDLGSWEGVYKNHQKDDSANASHGSVVAHQSSGNLLWSEGGLIAAFGIENMAVIQTSDATVVFPREKAPQMKGLVEEIKKTAKTLKTDKTTHRPWGTYSVLMETPFYKVKHIMVKSHSSLSLQLHHRRSEHWVVISGQPLVQVGEKKFTLKSDESTYVPIGCKHRLSNPTGTPVHMIEVQIGEYVGEDDIVRFEDQYGRE